MLTLFVVACTHPLAQESISSRSFSSDCHVLKHKLGQSCIPNNPQRVVTLHTSILAHALVLGIKPIGSTYIQELLSNSDTAPYLKQYLNNVKVLGGINPNLEKLLQLKPDLIIGYDWGKFFYPLLTRIAPTIISQGYVEDWRENFRFVAEALGRQEEADLAWKRYEQRIERLKLALGNRYQNQKISILLGASGLFSPTQNSLADSILKSVGLQRPQAQNIKAPYNFIDISEEEVEKFDGDILLIGVMTNRDREKLEALKRKPLWQKLRAVQQNRVYAVDYMTWYGSNLLAADAILDDLEKYLVSTPSLAWKDRKGNN